MKMKLSQGNIAVDVRTTTKWFRVYFMHRLRQISSAKRGAANAFTYICSDYLYQLSYVETDVRKRTSVPLIKEVVGSSEYIYVRAHLGQSLGLDASRTYYVRDEPRRCSAGQTSVGR
jgi:hypothetical protein